MTEGTGMDLLRVVLVFVGILALAGCAYAALRRFGAGALGVTGIRGRQPRLAVIEAAMIDTRRKLVLIRRDNVEHLIMIGGASDILIEPNIVRATAASSAREAAPARVSPSLTEPLPRAVPLADSGHWPLQPEPPARPQRAVAPPPPPPPKEAEEETAAHDAAWSPPEAADAAESEPRTEPAVRAEPTPRVEPPLRAEPTLRAEPMLRAVPAAEPAARPEGSERQVRPERPERPERPQRAARTQNPDRLAGMAANLSRNLMDMDLPPAPRLGGETRRPPPPPAQPVGPVQPTQQVTPADEQNLTEMAQRLESALQRPRQTGEPAPGTIGPTLRAVESPRTEPKPAPLPETPSLPAPAAKPPAKAAPGSAAKPAFGTLEQEMASLLGRSPGKT